MKRHLMNKLVAWKSSPGRKPLILRGVRQAGKTHLLSEFGRQAFRQCHLINFEKQEKLKAVFEQDLDPRRILDDLRFELSVDIDVEQDLVVFDEIQACPKALTSLKYFCEDLPELALCSAGSLLGLHLNDASYPVGKVDMLHLYPMTFSEFLNGVDDEKAYELIQNYHGGEFSELKHQRLWDQLKMYFVTGGLPEVVKLFGDNQDNAFHAMQMVREKQDQLIKAYYSDIAKHSGKVNAMHIDRTWRAVPSQLAQNYDVSTNRFRFKDIIPTASRYRDLVHVIDWLDAAELVLKLPIVGKFEQPIRAYIKDNLFKLMSFDVGLLGAMNEMDPSIILKAEYGTYKGYFAENFVAQQLIATAHSSIYSWQQDRSEIEFLMPFEDGVIPIEVKAGHVSRAKSLKKYIDYYSPKKSFILSAKPPYENKNKTVLHLPLYLVERLVSLI